MQDDSQCGDLVYEDTFQLTSDAAAGYLANLDDYLADYDAWNDGKSYVEATKAATYYDGSYYGIPSCTDSRGLVVKYRKFWKKQDLALTGSGKLDEY